MSEQLFSTHRLNRRIIKLHGYLSQLADNAVTVAEANTEDAASQLLKTLDSYSKETEAMVASLETLIRDVTGQEDDDGGIEVDARVGEAGFQL